MRLRFLIALVLACLSGISANAAYYPSRPITIIVPLPPKTATYAASLIVAQALAERLGQKIVVVPKPGAQGVIGTDYVKNARPDGYTLLMGLGGTMTLLWNVERNKLDFDPIRDFAPIAYVADTPYLLVARADTLRTVADLRSRVDRKVPTNFGAGANPPMVLGGLLSASGLPMQQVPYIGDPAVLNALLSREIQVAAVTVSAFKGTAGLSILATLGEERDPGFFPDVPTLQEEGFPREFGQMDPGIFLMGPAHLPSTVARTIAKAAGAALKDPKTAERLRDIGVRPRYGDPTELSDYLQKKLRFWKELLNDKAHPEWGEAVRKIYGE